MMPVNYRELWYSGELAKTAAELKRPAQLAAKYGVSPDALGRALRRLHEADKKVPKLHELFANIPAAAKPELPGSNVGVYSPGGGEEDLEPLEEHKLKKKVKELEAKNKELMDQLLNTRDQLGVMREAAQYKVDPLKPREHKSGMHEGCSLVCLSDAHIDEVVTSESVNGLNEYNPDIARSRMARLFEGATWLTKHARQANIVRDMVLWVGGDIISGNIHQDLTETNAMGVPQSIAFAQQLLADGIEYLLKDKELEHIRVVCSVGNHGRLTPKMRVHTRIETNIESLLYLSLAREFKNEKRISFDLPAGVLSYFEVYGRTVRAFHGDNLKYSGALGGLTNPINRAIARWDQARPSALSIMGHWHQYQDGGKWLVNGSVISSSPFSVHIAAPHERAQQAWALLDSKRWRSLSAPIFCSED